MATDPTGNLVKLSKRLIVIGITLVVLNTGAAVWGFLHQDYIMGTFNVASGSFAAGSVLSQIRFVRRQK